MLHNAPEVIIIGGGPGGYEAALTAAAAGAQVTLVEDTGVGGASVLTDCVPSKALVATGDYLGRLAAGAARLAEGAASGEPPGVGWGGRAAPPACGAVPRAAGPAGRRRGAGERRGRRARGPAPTARPSPSLAA